jgi:hypothetical protein
MLKSGDPMGTNPRPDPRADQAPTVDEIAELIARLRALTAASHGADPDERAAFLADKAALLARIPQEPDRLLGGTDSAPAADHAAGAESEEQ